VCSLELLIIDTYAEILDILRLKKLHFQSSRSRAVVSAEAVEDSDDADDNGA